MTKAFSYKRFSAKHQASGDSIARQSAAVRDWLLRHPDVTLDTSLSMEDLGVSAFDGRNRQEGLGVFLEAVRRGRVPKGSYLLVESLDRLSRQQISHALELLLSIVRSGVRVVTLMDGQEYNPSNIDDLPQLIISLSIMSRAHEESATKSRRIAAAWERKRQGIGERKLTKQCPFWLTLNRERSRYEPKREGVAVVKRIISKYLAGESSIDIVRTLNSEGVPNPSNRPNERWDLNFVRYVLRNPALIGHFHPKQKIDGKYVRVGEVIEDYFPAVIPISTFNKVLSMIQTRTRGRKKPGGGRTGTNFLFTGVARCYACKSPFYFRGAKNKPNKQGVVLEYGYAFCSNNRLGNGCKCSDTYNNDELEKAFFSFVDQELLLPDSEGSAEAELVEQAASADAKSTALHRRIERWQDAIADTDERDVKMGLIKRINEATREAARLRAEASRLRALAEEERHSRARADLEEIKRLARDKTKKEVRRRIQAEIKATIKAILINPRLKTIIVMFRNGKTRTCIDGTVVSEKGEVLIASKDFADTYGLSTLLTASGSPRKP